MAVTKLRAITYMSPSIPVEYYEAILHYLEDKLEIHTTLMYESRFEGPLQDRANPFKENEVDIGFMNSPVFLQLLKQKGSSVELLPVSSVHVHPKGENRAGRFSDVIIHKDLADDVKEFIDLRGCKWAYPRSESLTGHIVTLQTLKSLGENSTFFGNILPSGTHLHSIEMVLNKQADAAAVDANCLLAFLERNPHFKDDLKVLVSWGMLSPYPIVVNSRLPEIVRKNIISTLMKMHEDATGIHILDKYNIRRFAPICLQDYEAEEQLIKDTKLLSFDSVYY